MDDMVIDLNAVEYVNDYQLRLTFSDGLERVVDFKNFLNQSLNPMIQKYLDLEKFRNFSFDDGDLQWNDYDLCFPISDLYEGKI
jgi:hypothetical protein